MAVFLLLLLLLFDHPRSSLGCTGFSRVVAQRLSCLGIWDLINSFPTEVEPIISTLPRSILGSGAQGSP